MADIPQLLRSWSATASNNQPTGATPIGTNLDDNLRTMQAAVRQFLASPGSTIASAATVDLSTADGRTIPISGSITVTGLGTEAAGLEYLLAIGGTQTWKNSTALPFGADQVFVAGDIVWAKSEGAGLWTFPGVQRKNSQSDAIFKILGSADSTKALFFEVDTNVTAGATVVLTVPAISGTPVLGGDKYGAWLPLGYLSGGDLTYQSSTTMDIAPVTCRDSTNAANISTSTITGCALTASTAWVAGNSANKLNNQAIPANGTLHLFAMRKDADGTGDAIFDASLTPTLPSGYTYYRRIASRKTASSVWVPWTQDNNLVQYTTLQNDGSAFNAALSTSAANFAISVPNGIKVTALLQAFVSIAANGAGMRIFDPALTDQAIDPTTNAIGNIGVVAVGATNLRVTGSLQVHTNSSAQVRAVSNGVVGNADLRTLGFIDERGR